MQPSISMSRPLRLFLSAKNAFSLPDGRQINENVKLSWVLCVIMMTVVLTSDNNGLRIYI